MKKYLLILAALLPLCASAQEKIVETFDGSAQLEWGEFADKNGSALIQDGSMVLKPKKKYSWVTTNVSLPIDTENDFMIECELFFPKFKSIGIVFKGTAVGFAENSLDWKNADMGRFGSDDKIKLPAGRNQTVKIGIKCIGAKCELLLNNMEVAEVPLNKSAESILAFCAPTLTYIKSLTVEQY